MSKSYKLSGKDIVKLVPEMGPCYATDKITVEGNKVDYMIHQQFDDGSAWVFQGGGETQEYMDNPDNIGLYNVNTIANYDSDIIGFLTYPVGTEVERGSSGELELVDKSQPKPDTVIMLPLAPGNNRVIDWDFEILDTMYRRYEKGSLVLWKKHFTIYITIFNNDKNKSSKADIVEKIKNIKSQDSYNLEQLDDGAIIKLRYQLEENVDGNPQKGCYLFGISDEGHIQMAIYYDNIDDVKEIEKIWSTLSFFAKSDIKTSTSHAPNKKTKKWWSFFK